MLDGVSAAKGSIRHSALAPGLGRLCPCQATGLPSWLGSENQQWVLQTGCVNGEAILIPELTRKHLSLWETVTAPFTFPYKNGQSENKGAPTVSTLPE